MEPPADPVIAAAGDIACAPSATVSDTRCRQRFTSDLLVNAGLSAVLPLGDLQYDNGEYANFVASYDPTWGRVKPITYPAPGNHEYNTAGAAGYYGYFGAAAGDRAKGYYSFELGAWHLIALNSSCSNVGGCDAGSPQEQWLRADLASHPTACTLAYWHHPRFSSSSAHGSSTSVQALWQALYDHGADVVLSGHDHTYERFATQTPTGAADPARGIREFVVGTGGKSLYGQGPPLPNSEVFQNHTFGVLKLTLHPSGYDWAFVPEAGKTWTDTGSASCTGDTPPAPGNTPPIANGDAYGTPSSAPLSIAAPGVLANDSDQNGDSLTARNASDPPHGSLVLNPDGSFTYTPDSGYVGPDSFTYTAFDGSVDSLPATVDIAVDPGGSFPVAFGATADGYVRESSPGSTYNTTVLQIRQAPNSSSTNERWSYLKFETTIAGSAVLRLFVTTGSPTSNFGDVYEVGDGWSESSLRWTGRPPLGATLDATHTYHSGWAEWELGSLPAGTHSFVVANTGSTTLAFASGEHATSANRPQLVITPGTPSPPAAPANVQALAGDARIDLTWSAAAGATAYTVKRATASGGPYTAIASGLAATGYADSGLTNGTTYHYVVSAHNGAGESPNSSEASATPSGSSGGGGGTFTIKPIADSWVDSSQPSVNNGTKSTLRVDGSPTLVAYLRFEVPAGGTPHRATLRIFVNSNHNAGFGVAPVADSSWSETGIIYANAPTYGAVAASSGPFTAGSWVEVDVTSLVTASGPLSLALTPGSSTAMSLASRESGTNAPQLVIETH